MSHHARSNLLAAANRMSKKAYVALMMSVIGRGLVSSSRLDPTIHDEFSHFPSGYVIEMTVAPNGPNMMIQVQPDKTVRQISSIAEAGKTRPDLSIRFKHLAHAFLVLSFQESTPQAFANDRIVADGDVSSAIRMVRILSRMQALILPKLVAQQAIKRYPNISLIEKLKSGSRVYSGMASTLLPQSRP